VVIELDKLFIDQVKNFDIEALVSGPTDEELAKLLAQAKTPKVVAGEIKKVNGKKVKELPADISVERVVAAKKKTAKKTPAKKKAAKKGKKVETSAAVTNETENEISKRIAEEKKNLRARKVSDQ
jgi:hypothetical protein